jgi:hypothetical protein
MLVVVSRTTNHIYENCCIHRENNHHTYYKNKMNQTENLAMVWKHMNAWIWSDFDRASSLICGNKMPTRCNMFFYCRSYCLLNMFRAPLCPSSGAREYYTVGCRLWSLVLGFQFVGMVWSWGLCVRFTGCCFTGSSKKYIEKNYASSWLFTMNHNRMYGQ